MAPFKTANGGGYTQVETIVIDDWPRDNATTSSSDKRSNSGYEFRQTENLTLDDDDYMSDNTLAKNFGHLFPPSKHVKKKPPKPSKIVIPKEAKVELELPFMQWGNSKITAGKSVELDSGEFMRVHAMRNILTLRTVDNHILHSENMLTGKLFKRARELEYLKSDFNEVAMIENEAEANATEIKAIVKLVITNAPKPHFRGRGWLICRWVWDMPPSSKYEGTIRRVSEQEADENYKFKDCHLRDIWRKDRLEQYSKSIAAASITQERQIVQVVEEVLEPKPKLTVDLTSNESIEELSKIGASRNAIPNPNKDLLSSGNNGNFGLKPSHTIQLPEYTPLAQDCPTLLLTHTPVPNSRPIIKTQEIQCVEFQDTTRPYPQLEGKTSLKRPTIAGEYQTHRNCANALFNSQEQRKQTELGFSITKRVAWSTTAPFNNRSKIGRTGSTGLGSNNTRPFLPYLPKEALVSSKTAGANNRTIAPIFRSKVIKRSQTTSTSLCQGADATKSNYRKDIAGSKVISVLDEDDEVTPLYKLRRQQMFALPSSSFPARDDLWLDLTGEDIDGKLHSNAEGIPVIHQTSEPSTPTIIIDEKPATGTQPTQILPSAPKRTTRPSRTYTLGDAFCGGGGASCGAQLAGFKICWGVDHNKDAISTYRANFPEATSYHAGIDDFLTTTDATVVDVVHLSPPCQPYSPAHTIDGKNDEANQAALFAIGETLRHCRPRMATLEQTSGILNHGGYFLGMVRQLTDLDFSVTFKIVKCVEHGLAQNRKRLFIMAAGPGETLPTFPPQTHSFFNPPPPNLLPPSTLQAILSSIPASATEHEDRPFSTPKPPYRVDAYLNRTIMAGGGDYDVHPNGLRPFTVREVACIQGFPVDYKFSGRYTEKKRQVGNAVPPLIGKLMMKQVWMALERGDEIREEALRRSGGGGGAGGGNMDTLELPPAAVVEVDAMDDDVIITS